MIDGIIDLDHNNMIVLSYDSKEIAGTHDLQSGITNPRKPCVVTVDRRKVEQIFRSSGIMVFELEHHVATDTLPWEYILTWVEFERLKRKLPDHRAFL